MIHPIIYRLALLVVITATFAWLTATLEAADGQLTIRVFDRDTGQPIACRMHLKNAAGKPHRPKGVPFHHDHFVFFDKIDLKLPIGNYTFEMERGPEYLVRSGYFTINNFANDTKEIDMKRFVDMSHEGWWSGDLDARRSADEIELLMEADDLHIVPLVTWGNAKLPPVGPKMQNKVVLEFDNHRFARLVNGCDSRPSGTLLYMNADKPLKLPGAKTDFPPVLELALAARKQQPNIWNDAPLPWNWDFPSWVAAGIVDSVELANNHQWRDGVLNQETGGRPRDKIGFPQPQGNGRWAQLIYYHLLNCGLRIPPSAGSGSGDAPNPLGYDRMYVYVDGALTYQKWFEGFRAGRVVVTNGPLIRPAVEGQPPGHVFAVPEGQTLELEVAINLSTRDKIGYLEIVQDGRVAHSLRIDEYREKGRLPPVVFKASGWFLVRAVTDNPNTYRFASTGPYYVEIGARPRISKLSTQFFLDWIAEREQQLKLSAPEKQRQVLEYQKAAREFFEAILARANAE